MRRALIPYVGLVFCAIAVLAMLAQDKDGQSGYASANQCAGCHQAIWETYQKTGMGRAFAKPSRQNIAEGTYWHAPSSSRFTIFEREGRFYQRREHAEAGVVEQSIDFVMGSGNHARTFLHHTGRGTLIELPLGWYAEQGGSLAMNPGYDSAEHDDFRRVISYECMFCHNGYPRIPPGHEQPFAEPVYLDPLPQGIDCQRCHGPGGRHIKLAGAGAKGADIRGAIVNPARLPRESREEVCMQCHLETTSFPLPSAIRRYERSPFSHQPGQPLSRSWLFFDHARQAGREDKFEIVNAVYRMRQSRCYIESKGGLECRSCHNPHEAPRGEQARQHYDAACRQCHGGKIERHPPEAAAAVDGCASCHMPKRRTEDVVHAVATDHLIQRRAPADALAAREERHERGSTAYRGDVVAYPKSESELYTALAQVIEGSNRERGIPRLRAALARRPDARAEFHLGLAEALSETGKTAEALRHYREAAERSPRSAFIARKLGIALRRTGALAEARRVLEGAARLAPQDPVGWNELGLVHQSQGDSGSARAAFEKAIQLDPDRPEPHGNLGAWLQAAGDASGARKELREAIRIQPDYADAHDNLANLLASTGEFAQARRHFETAVRLRPGDAKTHYNFAMALGRARQFDEASRQLEAAVKVNPDFLDARLVLGELRLASGQQQAALGQFREAVRRHPAAARAHLALGRALAVSGDTNAAVTHLRKAAASAEPQVRESALDLLRQINQGR
jgi:predicted CXXCH cytochrome family protein